MSTPEPFQVATAGSVGMRILVSMGRSRVGSPVRVVRRMIEEPFPTHTTVPCSSSATTRPHSTARTRPSG
jgi:hypothetical protein